MASLRALLARDLAALRREIEAYPDDAGPWRASPGLANVAGTLALHCAGNLRHFVGAGLGGTGYVRDRAAEFSRRDVPRHELAAELAIAAADCDAALARLDAGRLGERFPDPVGGVHLIVGDLLIHLATHLAYHLGQVDAHRRITTGDGTVVGAMALRELATARPVEPGPSGGR